MTRATSAALVGAVGFIVICAVVALLTLMHGSSESAEGALPFYSDNTKGRQLRPQGGHKELASSDRHAVQEVGVTDEKVQEWISAEKAKFDMMTATTSDLSRAIAWNWITRESLGDDEFDRVLARIARTSLTPVSTESAEMFVARYTSCTPLERLGPAKGVTESARAEAKAVEKLYAPQREQLARNAVVILRDCLSRQWDLGGYRMNKPGESREIPWEDHEEAAAYRMSASTWVADRGFQMRFTSAGFPELEAAIQRLEELRTLVDAERRKIVAGR